MRATWHCHLAVSLDGRIARPDGAVDWLEPYPAEAFGIDHFLAAVDVIVMGRASYDAARRGGGWDYAGKTVRVVTSRPLLDAPPLVEARPASFAALAEELDAQGRGQGRAGVGVGRRAAAAGPGRGWAAGRLELAVIPRLLGAGIPLWPEAGCEVPLRLERCEAKPSGALHLVYARAG